MIDQLIDCYGGNELIADDVDVDVDVTSVDMCSDYRLVIFSVARDTSGHLFFCSLLSRFVLFCCISFVVNADANADINGSMCVGGDI